MKGQFNLFLDYNKILHYKVKNAFSYKLLNICQNFLKSYYLNDNSTTNVMHFLHKSRQQGPGLLGLVWAG